jgi:hypothetical protein
MALVSQLQLSITSGVVNLTEMHQETSKCTTFKWWNFGLQNKNKILEWTAPQGQSGTMQLTTKIH